MQAATTTAAVTVSVAEDEQAAERAGAVALTMMSWRRRRPRLQGLAAIWATSGEVAVLHPQPQGTRRPWLLLTLIAAVAILIGALVSAQSDCVKHWNSVLYRPDSVAAFIICVRGETVPVR